VAIASLGGGTLSSLGLGLVLGSLLRWASILAENVRSLSVGILGLADSRR
jgi:hypothetical protein